MKEILSFLLVASISFSVTLTTYANDLNLSPTTKKKLFSNNLKTKEAHIQELLTIGNNDIIVLDPHYFKSKILNCSEIIEVCTINDITYIQYNTAQGDYAILSIKNDTPIQYIQYNPKSDMLSIEENGYKNIYSDFIESSTYKIDNSTMKQIEYALQHNSYDNLYHMNGIKTHMNNDNIIVDYDPVSTLSTSKIIDGFVSPDKQFKPYTKKVVATGSKYNATLKKNISIKVKQSMNHYVREKFNAKSFVANTTLSIITAYLGLPMTSTVKVLTGLGIGISTANAIKTGVKLYKSASYTYSASKEGYAYDTTVHKKDVKVYFNSNKGKLHGGYNSNGVFTWIDYQHATALDVSNNKIIDKTSYNYNADILDNGMCDLYYPD